MIKIKLFSITLVVVMVLVSCKKLSAPVTPMASLNLINVAVNLSAVKANFTNTGNKFNSQYYNLISTSVAYGTNYSYSVFANQTVPLTIVSTADTTNPLYTASLHFATASIYSLYLTGQTGALDTIFVQESIPTYTDSLCGVRIINLNYNSKPIVVTQSAAPTTLDFQSLSYKQYSNFKVYGAHNSNASYVFQVRDAVTMTLLGAYTLSTPFFRNVTLAWIGQTGATGANAPKIIRINNY